MRHDAVLPWWDVPLLIGLGLLAGSLAGLLGIGGGLIFAPLLLWLDLPASQALATSSFAIVPTAMAGTITHRMMVLDDLCQRELGSAMRNNLSQVAASLGYELDHRFWDLLD